MEGGYSKQILISVLRATLVNTRIVNSGKDGGMNENYISSVTINGKR